MIFRASIFVFIATACRTNVKITEPSDEIIVISDQDADGYPAEEDCDDLDPTVHPNALEICDGIDNNCDEQIDEGVTTTFYPDEDEDGFGNDAFPEEHCTAPEGFVPIGNDCDDQNADIYTGNNELCDDLDNNCNGLVDEDIGELYFEDVDGDGYGNPAVSQLLCAVEEGYVLDSTDCDDSNSLIHPDATEFCDNIDNDCDLQIDEEASFVFYVDADGDGYGSLDSSVESCQLPTGYVLDSTDCDDSNPAINPSASEICDGLDNDCNAIIDLDAIDILNYFQDADGDGCGDPAVSQLSCSPVTGYTLDNTDCDDSEALRNPMEPEVCDELDNDCDGLTDDDDSDIQNQPSWYLDADGDGFGQDNTTLLSCEQPPSYEALNGDCDDFDATINPNATEACDSVDNNCDGQVDEGVQPLWYYDADGDGFGTAAATTRACTVPSGYADNPDDCDDLEAQVYPSAPEVCDYLDNDCNGQIDENVMLTWYLDADGDGFGTALNSVNSCTAPSTVYTSIDGDCDDLQADMYPGASLGCDGQDYDCDGLVDNDADGDGYSDASCGGSDCNDSDSTVYPDAIGLCALGTDCLDIYNQGFTTTGAYVIDPDGFNTGDDPEETWCEQTEYGGGWTLIAINSPLNLIWGTSNIRDTSNFGTITSGDFKARAFSNVPFTDVMFTDNILWAVYEGVGTGGESWADFSSSLTYYTCGSNLNWTMTAGTLSGGYLCNTNLHVHPIDEDGGANSICNSNGQWAGNAHGPTWSTSNNNGCPLDDPGGSSFIYLSSTSRVPWSAAQGLYFYVR